MKITASKFITYDVDGVIETLSQISDVPIEEISLAEVMDMIYGWAYEDFHGDMENVYFVDENGTDVEQLGLM